MINLLRKRAEKKKTQKGVNRNRSRKHAIQPELINVIRSNQRLLSSWMQHNSLGNGLENGGLSNFSPTLRVNGFFVNLKVIYGQTKKNDSDDVGF